MFDEVAILCRRTKAAFASATLAGIGSDRSTFDITTVGYGDRDVFVGNQVFNREFNSRVDNLGATFVAQVSLYLLEFLLNHATQRSFVRQDLFEFRDELDDAFVLVSDLLSFKC